MNPQQPDPSPRYFGLKRTELLIVLGLGVVVCSVIAIVAVFAARVAPTITQVVASAVPPADAPTREATRVPTQTPIPTATPIPTSTSTPTPAPTHTPQPGLSISRPLPPSSVFVSAGWEVRVLEVVRGEAAAQAVKTANQFNDPVPPGREYLLVRVRVKSAHTDRASHDIRAGDFRLAGSARTEYSAPGLVAPEPRLGAEVFAGGEVEGWLVFSIVNDEDQLILIWDPLLDSETKRIYVALTEGAALSIDPQLDRVPPSDLGRTREQPAPLGQAVVTTEWIIAALEAVRGEAAWSMAQAANQFNEPPEAGLEYVAVRVRAQYIKAEDNTGRLNSSFFKTLGSTHVVHDAPSVVDPKPALDVTLYPGGVAEGWIIVQAKIDESDLLLVFDPLFDYGGQNRRFLALTR